MLPWCLFLACTVAGKAQDRERWFVSGFLYWVSLEGLTLIVLNSAWLLQVLRLGAMCCLDEDWSAFELASAAAVAISLIVVVTLPMVRWWRAQKKPAGS